MVHFDLIRKRLICLIVKRKEKKERATGKGEKKKTTSIIVLYRRRYYRTRDGSECDRCACKDQLIDRKKLFAKEHVKRFPKLAKRSVERSESVR